MYGHIFTSYYVVLCNNNAEYVREGPRIDGEFLLDGNNNAKGCALFTFLFTMILRSLKAHA